MKHLVILSILFFVFSCAKPETGAPPTITPNDGGGLPADTGLLLSFSRESWPGHPSTSVRVQSLPVSGTVEAGLLALNGIDRIEIKTAIACGESTNLAGEFQGAIPIASQTTEEGSVVLNLAAPLLLPDRYDLWTNCAGKTYRLKFQGIPGNFAAEDEVVTEADVEAWVETFQDADIPLNPVVALELDFNLDGRVDIEDYYALQDRIGTGFPSGDLVLTSVLPRSGTKWGGTLLTVTGQNFFEGMSVRVQGKLCAALNVVSSTLASCLAPSGIAGPASVLLSPYRYESMLQGGYQFCPPVPGDYNRDGAVDGADYILWQKEFGKNNSTADGNGDGIVDAADYVIWRNHFGTPSTCHTDPDPEL